MHFFGEKVKDYRIEKKLTREEFCGDESELSIRQLARIESGSSMPTLNKIVYIAKQLDLSIGESTDEESLILPDRYKEIKYLLLRTPSYMNQERLEKREEYYDELYETYYDQLPEEEQLVIDAIRFKQDMIVVDNINFATGILEDYFEQVRCRKIYSLNDLVLIELYIVCINHSDFETTFFNEELFDSLLDNMLKQMDCLPLEDLFVLNNVLINSFEPALKLKKYHYLERIIETGNAIITKIQDFQKMPIFNLLEWKYYLFCLDNFEKAQNGFENSILFTRLINDTYLEYKLKEEWEKDSNLINNSI